MAIPAYQPGELAALFVMLLRIQKDENNGYESFSKQLEAGETLDDNSVFVDSVKAMIKFNASRPHLFEAAHFAIKSLLVELEEAGDLGGGVRWSSCKFVAPQRIQQISQL